MEQAWCGGLSEAIANNGVPFNEHPVVDFHARRVEASVVCRPVSTLKQDILNITYMIATFKKTMSKWQHCKLITGYDFFPFSFAVNVNEQRIIAFLTEKCCYLNLLSKVHTQLR